MQLPWFSSLFCSLILYSWMLWSFRGFIASRSQRTSKPPCHRGKRMYKSILVLKQVSLWFHLLLNFAFNDHPLTFNHRQTRRFKGKYGMKLQTKYIAEKCKFTLCDPWFSKIIKWFYLITNILDLEHVCFYFLKVLFKCNGMNVDKIYGAYALYREMVR